MVSGGRVKVEVDMAGGESRPFLAGGSSGESETEFTTDAEDMSLTEKKAPSAAATPKSALDLIGDNSGDLPDRPDGASNFNTIMNIIKGNLGSGVLALPNALSNAGIMVGTIGLLLMGIVATHCMHLLVKSSQFLCKRLGVTQLSYCEVAEQSVTHGPQSLSKHSRKARHVVNFLLCVSHFGFCSVYFLLIGKSIKLIVENSIGNSPEDEVHYILNYPMRVQWYEVIIFPICTGLALIKNVKHLGWISGAANFCALTGLGLILYYILFYEHIMPVSRLDWYKPMYKLPLYFGTVIFAYEGIGVVLPLENKIRERRWYGQTFGVLDLSMGLVVVAYITFGFYGYVEFGDKVSASIILDIKGGFGTAVQVLFILNTFASFALLFYVPIEIIGDTMHNQYLVSKLGVTIVNNLCRVFFVLLCFLAAVIVDEYLDLLISLIGAVGASGLSLFIPAFTDIMTFWPHRKNIPCYSAKLAKNIFIMLFAVIGGVAGTYVAVSHLVVRLHAAYSSPDAGH